MARPGTVTSPGTASTIAKGHEGSHHPLQKVFIHYNYIYGHAANDLIGGGPIDANCTRRDVIVSGNHAVQDFGASGAGTYFRAIDIVAMNDVVLSGNATEGHVKLGESTTRTASLSWRTTWRASRGGRHSRPRWSSRTTPSRPGSPPTSSLEGNSVEGGGIRVLGLSAQHATFVTVANNTVRNATGTSDTATFPQQCIFLGYADKSTVTGNVCEANGGTGTTGILAKDGVDGLFASNYVNGYGTGLKSSWCASRTTRRPPAPRRPSTSTCPRPTWA